MSDTVADDIAQWRSCLSNTPGIDQSHVDELEAHLRDQMTDLEAAGLSPDEAFLIAVRRLGKIDEISQEIARQQSGLLWRQLGAPDGGAEAEGSSARTALVYAAIAAIVVILARVVSEILNDYGEWAFLNAPWMVLQVLAAWFVSQRARSWRLVWPSVAASAAAAIVINLYPYGPHLYDSQTETLALIHIPVVLWGLLAIPFTGGVVRSTERVMDFVRFTGEWCIYYVLIALGGMVFTALTAAILYPIGVDPSALFGWGIPACAAAAVIIAAYLVEAKQQVVENMAPVLTMIFTPAFAVMLSVTAAVYAFTVFTMEFDRELLATFDALLVVVLALVLYSTSARDPLRPPGWQDRIQVLTVVSAMFLDVLVLGSVLVRISDLGFTPNRVVALGMNIVLLVDLAGVLWRSFGFVTGRTTFLRLERWHVLYLPVFVAWAAFVAVALPIVFGFN